jgi:RNA polymerase sigma-70 factor, ECF subfamily
MLAQLAPQKPNQVLLEAAVSQPAHPAGCSGASQKDSAEASLIRAAREGDLHAFNCLVLDHQDSLYGWVVSLVQDEALADDVTQAAFITAYEKINQFKGGSFRAWLFMIARNRSIDEMRRLKRRPALSLDAPAREAEEADSEWMISLADHKPLPEQVLEQSEQAWQIEQMLRQLPDISQQVLRLVDMEGMDYQEAANILGLPLGTVKSRLVRARLKLRDLLLHSGSYI